MVLAADGYPDAPKAGTPVPRIELDEDSHVYYYGGVRHTADLKGLEASSGRVLVCETVAPSLEAAQQRIYSQLDGLDTTGFFYRHDIGDKALKAVR